MRAFIGFDFSEELKKRLTDIQAKLIHKTEKGSWVSNSNFHLTLKFLGEIDENQIDSIDEILKKLSTTRFPINVYLDDLGYFNKKGNEYRVVWLGLKGQIDDIDSMYHELEKEMHNIGFEKEGRRFSPHITLGRRVRTKVDFNELKVLVEPLLGERFILDNLVLMKSQVTMGKRVYTPNLSHKLKNI